MNKDFFKKPDFDNRLKKATETLRNCLAEKKYELNELKVEELIQWNDVTSNGPRNVYPHNECPPEIVNIVSQIIEQEFKE